MRQFKYILLWIFFLFIGINADAQHVGTIENFEVLPQYLTHDGKIKISNTSETIIKYKVSFARVIANSGVVGSFRSFNMSVQLATNKGIEIVLLGAANKVTSANFGATSGTLAGKEFTATIDNSKLSRGGRINLSYTINDNAFPINTYNYKEYLFELPEAIIEIPPIITPVKPSSTELLPVYRKKAKNGGHYLTLEPTQPVRLRGDEIAFYVKPNGGSGVNWYHQLIHWNDDGSPEEFIYRAGSYNSNETPYWQFMGLGFPASTFPDNSDSNLVPIHEFKNKYDNNRYYTTDIQGTPHPDYELQKSGEFYVYPVPNPVRPGRAEDPVPRPPREGGPERPNRG